MEVSTAQTAALKQWPGKLNYLSDSYGEKDKVIRCSITGTADKQRATLNSADSHAQFRISNQVNVGLWQKKTEPNGFCMSLFSVNNCRIGLTCLNLKPVCKQLLSCALDELKNVYSCTKSIRTLLLETRLKNIHSQRFSSLSPFSAAQTMYTVCIISRRRTRNGESPDQTVRSPLSSPLPLNASDGDQLFSPPTLSTSFST